MGHSRHRRQYRAPIPAVHPYVLRFTSRGRQVFVSLGRLVYRFRMPIVGAWLLLGLASLPLAPQLPRILKAGGYGDPRLESQRAAEMLGSALGWKSSTL